MCIDKIFIINLNKNDPFFPEVFGQLLFENGQIFESIEQLKITAETSDSINYIVIKLLYLVC